MDRSAPHIVCVHCGATNRVPADRLADDPACGRCGRPVLAGTPADLDEAGFDRVVAHTDLPVLVDFWAPWCGPCRTMAPAFAQAAAQLKGRALLVKVNSDDHPRLAGRFGIRGIPTLIRLQGGRETARQSGALPAQAIVALAAD
ncbi:MAG: thioredoxin TrxC [Rubrivivax sp.]|nr:thioredoxin TrxC [Rubrivivax sp.]